MSRNSGQLVDALRLLLASRGDLGNHLAGLLDLPLDFRQVFEDLTVLLHATLGVAH